MDQMTDLTAEYKHGRTTVVLNYSSFIAGD